MFAIKLANELGWTDVDAMLDAMTPQQFNERMAYQLVVNDQVAPDVNEKVPPPNGRALARKFGIPT